MIDDENCALHFDILHWCHLRLIIVHLAVVARGNFANDQCWWLAKCKHSQYWHTYIHTHCKSERTLQYVIREGEKAKNFFRLAKALFSLISCVEAASRSKAFTSQVSRTKKRVWARFARAKWEKCISSLPGETVRPKKALQKAFRRRKPETWRDERKEKQRSVFESTFAKRAHRTRKVFEFRYLISASSRLLA